MRALRIALTALVLAGGPAAADVTSPRPDAVALALYHMDGVETSELLHPERNLWVLDEGLAFITETREVDLPAGPSTIHLRGVASTIVPQTATIDGLPFPVLEQDFDYDLLTRGSLLAKSIGRTVHVVRTDPKTGKSTAKDAVVRSGPNGVVLEIAGKFEALHCSGGAEKIVFESVPDGLTDTPTLSVRANVLKAGHYTLKLSYIATGLNWSADYVARIAPDRRTLDLSGWITLANASDTGFGTIPVDVVAGKLSTTGDDAPVHPDKVTTAPACWPTTIDWAKHLHLMRDLAPPPPPPPPPAPPPPRGSGDSSVEAVVVTGSRVPDPRALGDYKIYTLPEPTLFSARQTKQINFLEARDVPFEKVYAVSVGLADDENDEGGARVLLRLKNDDAGGLGKPLPAGTVTAMEGSPDGAPMLAGQASIRDTAVGLPMELEIAHAVDVRVAQHVVRHRSEGPSGHRIAKYDLEIDVENDKSVAIRFEVRGATGADSVHVMSESKPHTMDRGELVWSYDLAPYARARLDVSTEDSND
jgi:hypothetical protein